MKVAVTKGDLTVELEVDVLKMSPDDLVIIRVPEDQTFDVYTEKALGELISQAYERAELPLSSTFVVDKGYDLELLPEEAMAQLGWVRSRPPKPYEEVKDSLTTLAKRKSPWLPSAIPSTSP